MIDHVSLHVSDVGAARTFYAAALAPLDYTVLRDYTVAVGLGVNGKPDLWLAPATGSVHPVHIALRASSRAAVDAFYAAAIAAGARDHGAPGLRPHYHANYYGAFVLDADGNNLEAVCHLPEGA